MMTKQTMNVKNYYIEIAITMHFEHCLNWFIYVKFTKEFYSNLDCCMSYRKSNNSLGIVFVDLEIKPVSVIFNIELLL